MVRRILVLGHTGFIGGSIYRHLRQALPQVEVIGLSRAEADLTQPSTSAALARYCDQDTVVIMCAAIVRQAGDSLDHYAQNVQMATTVAKTLETRPVKRLIFLSSSAVYGEDVQHAVITEQTPVQPKSYYGMAKCASEWLLEKVAGEKTSFVALRPPTVYGPGERISAYGPHRFTDAVIDREPITLWGDGKEAREFIYIDDVVRIVERMLEHSFTGVLNVVSGVSYSFLDVIDVLSKLAGYEPRTSSRPRSKQLVDHHFSNGLLQQVLPDTQFTTLADGLRHTYESESATRRARRSLSIIIPTLNEEEAIIPTVMTLLPRCRRDLDRFELILVNDGSTDRTGEVMEQLARDNPEIVVIHHPDRRGVGKAFRSGIDRARMEYLTLVPGDNVCDPVTWEPFFQAIGTADIVVAYRANQRAARALHRVIISRLFSHTMCVLHGIKLRDFQGLVIYPSRRIKELGLEARGFMYQLELLVQLHREGFTIAETPFYMLPEGMQSSRSLKWSTFVDLAQTMWRLTKKRFGSQPSRTAAPAQREGVR